MTDMLLMIVLLTVCFGVGLVTTLLLTLSIVQKIFGRYKGGGEK